MSTIPKIKFTQVNDTNWISKCKKYKIIRNVSYFAKNCNYSLYESNNNCNTLIQGGFYSPEALATYLNHLVEKESQT